jgi:S-adenosylmethionine:diacylglycerol 3-amino-3-carboxypropyl transferase
VLRSGIVFTRILEDHEVDRRALAITRGDAVLVIASAGDKALDAVAWGAGRVTAVDTNMAQLQLLALKLAALRVMGSDDLLAFFSVGRRPGARIEYEERLRDRLDEPARAYWDRWIDTFEVGLHQHNPLGLAISGTGLALRALGGRRLLPTIMRAGDAAAQARVYDRVLSRRYWNRGTRWLLGRPSLRRTIVLDPQERLGMEREGFADWLEARVGGVVRTSLVRENPYWMPILTGRPVDPRHELPWLRPDALTSMRDAADRVRLAHGSVVDLLELEPASSLDVVDLSNVPDWVVPEERSRMWRGLVRCLRPGGRVLLRSTFQEPPLPVGDLARYLVHDEAVSAGLAAEDRTGIWRTAAILRRRAAP